MKKWSMFLCLFALLTSCGGNPSSSDLPSSPVDSTPGDSTPTPAVDDKVVIAEKVALAKQNKGKVKSGTITKTDLLSEDEDFRTDVYKYEFGESAFTYYSEGEFGSTRVYCLDADGEVFGVEESFGSIFKPFDLCEENLEGYPFSGIISYDYKTSYGAEALVSDFYDEAIANTNKDAKFVASEANYEFSFGIKADSESFVTIKVNFALSEANALKTVNVFADTYSSENFVDDIELGTVTLKENAEKQYSYSFEVEQVEGERTYVSKYNPSDFYFTSFDLSYQGQPVSEETIIEVSKGSDASIAIENAVPETANLNFDVLSVEVTSGNTEGINFFVNTFANSVDITAIEIGDYEVTIKGKNVTKVVKVKVVEPMIEDFIIYKCIFNAGEGNYTYQEIDSNAPLTVYRNKPLILTAFPDPYAADGSYEARLTSPSEGVTLNRTEVSNVAGETAVAYEFTFSVIGDYHIEFVSTVNSEIRKVVDLSVIETPDVKDVVNGLYIVHSVAKGVEFEFEFTPAEGGLSGNVVVKDVINSLEEHLVYVVNDTTIDLTHESGDTIIVATSSLKLNDSYQLVFSFEAEQWGEIITREEILKRKTPSIMILGRYSATIGGLTYVIDFSEEGAFMNYHDDANEVFAGTFLEYTIADVADEKGYTITWTSKENAEFSVIDVTNTESYLTADYQELHLTIVVDGEAQSVLFAPDAN